jgi:FkbM family methyltransferase
MSFLNDLSPNDVVYDIGANVGMYTCFAMSALGSGEVIGFEPEPRNADRLRENLQLNGHDANRRVKEYALGEEDDDGYLDLKGSELGSGRHVLADHGIDVTVRRVDTLVESGELPRPDVVKIDVEGAEMAVLRGMECVLGEVRVIYCEVHRDESDSGPTEVGDYLRSRGFDVEQINKRGGATHLRAVRE